MVKIQILENQKPKTILETANNQPHNLESPIKFFEKLKSTVKSKPKIKNLKTKIQKPKFKNQKLESKKSRKFVSTQR